MKICKIFEWDACHQLKLSYDSPCNRRHGHRYKIAIELEGPINKEGMVMDFGELKDIINTVSFDHSDLNEDIPLRDGENPTAENLVLYLYWRLMHRWKKTYPKITKIRIWETPTSYAEQTW